MSGSVVGSSLEPLSFFLMVSAAGILAGALGSLLGIGGGLIIIPALTLFAGVDLRYAMGAS
ncbi:MAG: sulfite exporter TauE/SafE family protein, partial [Polyangia bacterium]